jgi:hypothetical protein
MAFILADGTLLRADSIFGGESLAHPYIPDGMNRVALAPMTG